MTEQEEFRRETSELRLSPLELAHDYKHVRADSYFVGIAAMSEADRRLVVSVFENQIEPAMNEQGEVGARFVRKAVATFVSDVAATRELHAALTAALADIDADDRALTGVEAGPRGQE